jgi:hypothetical protein
MVNGRLFNWIASSFPILIKFYKNKGSNKLLTTVYPNVNQIATTQNQSDGSFQCRMTFKQNNSNTSSRSSSVIYKPMLKFSCPDGLPDNDNLSISLKKFISQNPGQYIDQFTKSEIDWTESAEGTIESCLLTPSFSARSTDVPERRRTYKGRKTLTTIAEEFPVHKTIL